MYYPRFGSEMDRSKVGFGVFAGSEIWDANSCDPVSPTP